MKLLGHRNANMTLRYVEITQQDLQREFHQARTAPRHFVPPPPSASSPEPDVLTGPAIRDRLAHLIRLLDLFRQETSEFPDKDLRLLVRRLSRIRSRFEYLTALVQSEK